MFYVKALVKGVEEFFGRYLLLEVVAPEVSKRAVPGQFVRVKAWQGFDPLVPRPFSVFEVREESVRLLVAKRGKGSSSLFKLHTGDEVELWGPFGRGFPFPERGPVWVVAGGVGIAPFKEYLKRLSAAGKEALLFWGGRSYPDFAVLEEFQGLAEVVLCSEDGTVGKQGLVTEAVEEVLLKEEVRPEFVLSCGPVGMFKELKRLSETYDLKVYGSFETFMACGAGMCLGCVVKRYPTGLLRVCTQGPCFDLSEVDLSD